MSDRYIVLVYTDNGATFAVTNSGETDTAARAAKTEEAINHRYGWAVRTLILPITDLNDFVTSPEITEEYADD